MKNSYELFSLIGKNFKYIRKNIIKCSQEKLAEDCNMSRSFISQIEGPNVDAGVSLDTLFYIAQKYNFDIREFFKNYENLMNAKNHEEN